MSKRDTPGKGSAASTSGRGRPAARGQRRSRSGPGFILNLIGAAAMAVVGVPFRGAQAPAGGAEVSGGASSQLVLGASGAMSHSTSSDNGESRAPIPADPGLPGPADRIRSFETDDTDPERHRQSELIKGRAADTRSAAAGRSRMVGILEDKDRIFTNLYGFHDWGLEGAKSS